MTIDTSSPQSRLQAIEQALHEAVALHQAGQLQEAEKLYRDILQLDPVHPEANHSMGVLSVQQNQAAAGLPYFIAALDADPAHGKYWLNYIDALFQDGQLEEARQILALAQQHGLEGGEVEALAVRLEGGAKVADQSNAEHRQDIKESLAGSSAIPQSKNNSKSIKLNKSSRKTTPNHGKNPGQQEIDTLVALFNQGRFTEATTLARTMSVRFPRHWIGWKMLGVIFQQTGRNADALVPMQKTVALAPGDAEAHNNLGIILQNLSRLDEAEVSYRRALKINPGYAHAHGNLGATLQALGRLDEAEVGYRQALKIDPDYTKAHNNLGSVLQDMGRSDEAEASYRHALQINPNHVEALYNLGATLNKLGRQDEAEASYRRALQINPDYADAHYNLGKVLQEMNRLDEAENCFRLALKINPNYAEVHCNLGIILKDMGRLAESESSYLQALQIKPEFTEAQNNLGATLLELGRLGEAEASYRRALATNPNYAKAHNNLGAALLAMGRLDEAEASYRLALEIKPDFAEAYSNLGHILCDLDDPGRAAIAYRKAMDMEPDKIGLDAAVYLAILNYLSGNLEQCRNMLCTSQSIMAQADDKHKNVRSYWRYLDCLLACQPPFQSNYQQPGLKTLYVIGESHSLSTHGVVIRYNNQEMRCAAEWIAGCKQWHLGNGKRNKYKQKFEAIMARLPRESTVLLAIGEIDCRHDEGILKAWEKYPGKELAEIAQATIGAYLDYVAKTGRRYGHWIIIEGVPATNFPLDTLTPAVADQLVQLIRTFNAISNKLAIQAGMGYLDVYALTDRGDGIANGQWHIDSHHLLPAAIAEAFDKFCH